MNRLLSDWINGYMAYTDNSEPPFTYRMWAAISIIASALQRKCFFPWGTLTFYPNMYIVLVGPAGKARKGTAMAPMLEFLNEINVRMAAESTTREALVQALREASDTTPDIETGRIFPHSSLTIWSPELTVFLGYNNNALLSDLTDWYDCRSKWIYRTKGCGTDEIVGVYVNLIGATTPDLIRTTLPLDAIGGGLTSRMIFVYEEDKGKKIPYPGLSPDQEEVYTCLKKDLERIHVLRGEFKAAQSFVDRWFQWYLHESDPPWNDQRFAGYFERRANHVMKLSMILNASRTGSKFMELEDIDRALGILSLTEQKMRLTFSGVGGYKYAAVMQQITTEVLLRGQLRKSDLLKMFHRDIDDFGLDNIIRSLEVMQTIRVTHDASGDPLLTVIKN